MHCIGGASGDMLLGALVDAGFSVKNLEEELSKLSINDYFIETQSAHRGIVNGTQVIVNTQSKHKKNHSIQNFIEIIQSSSLSHFVKEKACEVLVRLEAAEAKVHGEGHDLQELGDIDTIIDVVGVIVGLKELGIERLYSSPLPCGWGVIASRKGPLPVPAPATVELIKMANARIIPPAGPYMNAGELVTPTGAALITTLASFDVPSFNVEHVGYGIGSKDIAEIPNVLGLWVGNIEDNESHTQVSLLETNIDDSTPEILGYVQEKLLRFGALDAWFTPIQMKKNRPAVALSVICRMDMEATLIKMILEESSTLGVRIHSLKRYEAEREVVLIQTSLGQVRVKIKKMNGVAMNISPEFEDCKLIAEKEELPLQEVYRRIDRDTREKLGMY